MRGIIIFEDSNPTLKNVYCIKLNNSGVKLDIDDDCSMMYTLTGNRNDMKQASCNKEDTYDFETGALISLMRMCGAKKVAEACCEAFPHETSGSIYRENKRYIKRIKELEEENKRLSERQPSDLPRRLKTKNEILKKDNDRLIDTNILLIRENNELEKANEELKKEKEQTIVAKNILYNKLKEDKDLLIHENNKLNAQIESLESDKDKSWRNYQRNIQKKEDRINELNVQIECLKTKIGTMAEKEADLIDTNKSLTEARNHLLSESMQRLRDKINLKEKYVALEAENEKLKLDCEKLRHGYSAGLGRLVNINGVNYRECDEKGRVVWMTSQPERFSFFADYIDTDMLDTLRSWHKKPDVSKREKMWDNILKEGRTSIYVKAEDVADFLDECTIMGVTWISGNAPNKQRPYFSGEGVYFFIGSFKGTHRMTWQNTEPCLSEAEAKVDVHYVRPMRWDLFEKGRIYVKVKPEHFEEFQKACQSHLERGKAPNTHYFNDDSIVVNLPKEGRFCVTKHLRGFKKRPIVDWEDVR